MITIKFDDDVVHKYMSFDEILALNNYNEITYLNCSSNNLTSLQELPKSLTNLRCNNNKLTSLPELPKALKTLNCDSNNLTILPKLPKSLTYLRGNDNKLTSLPELPKSLTHLNCDNNNLPDQLKRLPQETTKITKFFKNIVLAQKRAIQILLAKSVENFYHSPDCKIMMKIREKQWKKYFK